MSVTGGGALKSGGGLNALALRIRGSVLARHPEWEAYAGALPGGDLQIAVPAPAGSRAGQLVILTARGEDTWVGFARPRACYCAETERELHAVVDALLADDAFFVVVTDGDEWLETALLRPGQEPVLGEGQVADAVSWSGRHDRIVTFTARPPRRGA